MSPSNGEQKQLSYNEKLDVLLQTLTTLVERVEAIFEQQEELAEKLANISISGSGFDVDEYDN